MNIFFIIATVAIVIVLILSALKLIKIHPLLWVVGFVILAGLTMLSVNSDDSDDISSSLSGDSSNASTGAIDPSNPPADFLRRSFPNTDFSRTSIDFDEVLTGGPGKDGIPAIDEPTFVPLSESTIDSDVQAIVYEGESEVRAYPYNILNWHEIVNDTVDGVNFSVTFCPLCGSAIVFDRDTSAGTTTFGVSGALRESNMIMYDRGTETLWQQSTGEAIAGELLGETLPLLPFQLLTLDELADLHPDAKILSTNTGFSRDYERNPYSGYEDNDQFFFRPSSTDDRYGVKDIFVIVNSNDRSVAIPNASVRSGDSFTDDQTGLTISKEDGEITIADSSGNELPFYFEMWFSWAVQHEDDDSAIVFDPLNN